MREPTGNTIKAWAPDYTATPFYFVQKFEKFDRLVAWSDDPAQIKSAFITTIDLLPDPLEILLKVDAGRADDGEPLWTRYSGQRRRDAFIEAVKANEFYVFADGAHQLTVKDPAKEHYLTFDEHGIFFIYQPAQANREVFHNLGFAERESPLLYDLPHYQRVSSDPTLQRRFIGSLGLLPASYA